VTDRPVHYTPTGDRAVCGATGRVWLAFDPNDTSITCRTCRIYLAGYAAGKEAR
jgi:hypothetical protein